MAAFLPKLALIGAAFTAGSFLRSTNILSKQDAKAATLALTYGTLPSLALQNLLTYGFMGLEGAAIGGAALLVNIIIAIAAWGVFSGKRGPDRGVLAGSAVGVAVGSLGYAFVEAAFGGLGLHFAILWDLGNVVAVSLLSYLLFASFGTVAPERYVHADGGIYRGQWQGGKKEGLGVYTYPGGGRYEGRWIDNLKDGIGIYYFPKGGWYEGEWREGERAGVGLRVMSSGRVQAGSWQGTKVLEERELKDCTFISYAARETAAAAKKVPVGGGSPIDAALHLLSQPLVWVAAAAALSAATSYQIPAAVDLVTAHLAAAHIPLSILVFGVNADFDLPSGRQVGEVATSLALRCLVPLVIAASAALLLSQRYVDAIAIAAICAMGPVSEQVPYYYQLFKLNSVVGGRLLSASRIASLAGLAVLTLGMVVATPPTATLSKGALAVAVLVSAAILAVAGSVAAWLLSQQQSKRSIRSPPSARLKGPAARPQAPTPVAAASNIPIGIAWQEARQEAPVEDAGIGSEAERKLGAGGGEAVDLDKQDTGEGGVVGKSSEVSSWDEAGNVLVGSQDEEWQPSPAEVSAAPETDGKLDLGEADFDLGGRFPDLASTSSSEPSDQPDVGGSPRGRRRRRQRGGNSFEDVDEEVSCSQDADWPGSEGWPEQRHCRESRPLPMQPPRHRGRNVSADARRSTRMAKQPGRGFSDRTKQCSRTIGGCHPGSSACRRLKL